MSFHTQATIVDTSQIGEARRTAQRLCRAHNWNETIVGNVSIVVTELATNLIKYGQQGQLLMRADPQHGFDVLAIDKGPGMNAARCIADGYSTSGTAGNGLGAVKRLSHEFDIYSRPESGTVVFARISTTTSGLATTLPSTATMSSSFGLQFAGATLCMMGESVSGDAWSVKPSDDIFNVIVVDGLGHGPQAAEAAQIAIDTFENDSSRSPKALIESAHRKMIDSRGGAVALGALDLGTSTFTYAGVGNISSTLVSATENRGLMSYSGTVGAQMRTVHQSEYAWTRGTMLVMHSDGLMSRWDLSQYPGLLARHPAVCVGVLLRDFNRGRDDVTVVVIKRL